MNNYVSEAVVCNAKECAMAQQCIRYINFTEERNTEKVLQVLNTSLVEIGQEGCEYLHVAREVKAARGFKKMYATIPHGAATGVWHGFPGRISRRQFYRLLNGEVMLLPEDQAAILSHLASKGADTTLGFDEYEMVTV